MSNINKFLECFNVICPIDDIHNLKNGVPKILHMSFDARTNSVYKIELEIKNDIYTFKDPNETLLFVTVLSWLKLEECDRQYIEMEDIKYGKC